MTIPDTVRRSDIKPLEVNGHTATSEVYLMDCIEGMKLYPDNYFDLAVCDPPYGIGEDGKKNHSRGGAAKPTMYAAKEWDRQTPSREYFTELFRVSKRQIVWGGNYFDLPPSPCWLVWDKQNGDNDFADCELAWTSFASAVRKFQYRWAGMLQGNMREKEFRIHPTQKPVALYDWIFHNYAKPGDKILDGHLGSASSRIAANKAGLDFTGFEIDVDYFEAQEKRFRAFISQTRMF